MRNLRVYLLVLAAVMLVAPAAFGQAVITLPSGNVSLGVAAYGQLGAGSLPAGTNSTPPFVGDAGNLGGYRVGIYLTSQKADSVAPGCYCEGWGAAYNGSVSGYAANDDGGNFNISGVSFASTATTATAVTKIGNLQISQAYAPAAGAGGNWLFQDTVTLTNTSGATMNNVQFARSTDWDINPTEFHESETLGGWGATDLAFSTNNGFCTPDPLAGCSGIGTTAGPASMWTDANFTLNGVADQGSQFVFNFGSLAAGDSITFNTFYGAADNGAEAKGALVDVGAEVYVLGYATNGAGCTPVGGTCVNGAANLDSGTWVFGFNEVGGTPVTP